LWNFLGFAPENLQISVGFIEKELVIQRLF